MHQFYHEWFCDLLTSWSQKWFIPLCHFSTSTFHLSYILLYFAEAGDFLTLRTGLNWDNAGQCAAHTGCVASPDNTCIQTEGVVINSCHMLIMGKNLTASICNGTCLVCAGWHWDKLPLSWTETNFCAFFVSWPLWNISYKIDFITSPQRNRKLQLISVEWINSKKKN